MASTIKSWTELAKAVDDAFIYGRFLPRTAEKWQKEAKKITTANLAKPFQKKIVKELFPNLNIYNNKILVFSQELLARVKEINFKPKEVAALIENIIKEIWGEDYTCEESQVRGYIKKLRDKLEEDAANPKILVTERTRGYILVIPK